jgi:late competence protein required for DNA uptake (superfamily II DNA/RNA helicase)
MKNTNSIAKEIARELRSGNKSKCFSCCGEHPKRKVYLHDSGRYFCQPHLVMLARGKKP